VKSEFSLVRSDGPARLGRFETGRGAVATPAFMPVGTVGSVKGLTPQALTDLGAQVMLCNLYHLALRPGIEVVEAVGGLHRFTGWNGPILTDSGGFQVFSLAGLRTVNQRGVTFRSHIDGELLEFSPESVVSFQERMGVDIAMMLDECPPASATKKAVGISMRRTNQWAARARAVWKEDGASRLFAIAQGGVFEELRQEAVEALAALDFPGYAIGGVSVGESLEDRRRVVEFTAPLLPSTKPRYLMGVGTPLDILHAVRQGVDLFDCVLPSRNARHGVLFTRLGPIRIKNARFRRDSGPVDEDCSCPACTTVSRAFLHHLIRTGEITGLVLATQHNISFFLDFMRDLREAIASGATAEWAASFTAAYTAADPDTTPTNPASC
jgi:queuine tRNA-ribosyltransferase